MVWNLDFLVDGTPPPDAHPASPGGCRWHTTPTLFSADRTFSRCQFTQWVAVDPCISKRSSYVWLADWHPVNESGGREQNGTSNQANGACLEKVAYEALCVSWHNLAQWHSYRPASWRLGRWNQVSYRAVERASRRSGPEARLCSAGSCRHLVLH